MSRRAPAASPAVRLRFLLIRSLGRGRFAGSVALIAGAVTVIVCALPAAAGGSGRAVDSRSQTVRVVFTGNGGGRYLDVTRWLHDDTRECYARKTADETVAVSWRLIWTVRLRGTPGGYRIEPVSGVAATIAGSAAGTAIRDSCDAAEEEEPGWSGSSTCRSRLPVETSGRLEAQPGAAGAELFLRGPVFAGPAQPCELQIRNDQLVANLGLSNQILRTLAAGKTATFRVGTWHGRANDHYAPTLFCSAFPHIYDGVVYLYDCRDTLVWNGAVSFSPSR
jgi:hypothetical protein